MARSLKKGPYVDEYLLEKVEKENEFYVIKNSKGEVLAKDTTKEGIMKDKGMFLNLYAKGGSMARGGEIYYQPKLSDKEWEQGD